MRGSVRSLCFTQWMNTAGWSASASPWQTCTAPSVHPLRGKTDWYPGTYMHFQTERWKHLVHVDRIHRMSSSTERSKPQKINHYTSSQNTLIKNHTPVHSFTILYIVKATLFTIWGIKMSEQMKIWIIDRQYDSTTHYLFCLTYLIIVFLIN